jgi:hypothetical protein
MTLERKDVRGRPSVVANKVMATAPTQIAHAVPDATHRRLRHNRIATVGS